jgi:TolB-like protein/Flp pilus assembly protein TadD
MIGKTISHYKILSKLGEGGMGVVYKAQDLKLPRCVAIKLLPAHIGSDSETRRFMHEAQAASALDHPNICSIHEIDETPEGQVFMVMPCYEGEPLAAKIARGPLPLGEAVDIAIQVASGLSKAHEKGIVHRDVKPGNVFLTNDGLVKIVDFGLAKMPGQTRLTKSGTAMGTIMYMSPEQGRGGDVDHRSDIWSLGAVLYEMVTGRPPFSGEYEAAVIYSIMNEEAEPPTALRTGVPMELERIINKCMAKEPGERYQHADELVADLRRMKADWGISSPRRSPAARPVARGPSALRWLSLAALVVVAAVTIGLVLRYRTSPRIGPASERKMLAVLPFVNLGQPEDEYFAAGITEEITSRLATIKELGVISRTSAVHYAGADKTIRQIGNELGVQYILEGTVRWAHEPGGESRVRITPQLIRVSDDTHLWSQPYDRVIEDIFGIQSDIAQNVVEHLGLALLAKGHPAVGAAPTSNLEAYQAYLRAQFYAGQPHFAVENWENAIRNYERAVELDSTFTLAYARLAMAHATLYYYWYDSTEERLAKARAAVNRARELEPNAPEVHLALGYFHLQVERNVPLALKEFEIAGRDLPDNADILEAKGNASRQEGHWMDALDQYSKACELDPRSGALRENLAESYWWCRRYQDALESAERAIALSPDQMWPYLDKVFNYWSWKGSGALRESRAALEAMGRGQDPDWTVWAWFFQAAYEGKYEDALGYLASFPNDWIRIKIGAFPKSLLSAQMYELLNEPRRAEADYKNAAALLEREVAVHPEDPRYHSSLGIAYAVLGHREKAVEEGERAEELLPISKDAVYGIPYVIDLAHIYTILGEQDAALRELERVLTVPSWISVAWLSMDFRWNRLRDNPRFKELIQRYSPPNDAEVIGQAP